MFVVMEMNEYCWPELVAGYETYEQAEAVVIGAIACTGKTLVRRSGSVSAVTQGAASETYAQEQFWTEDSSYHSYVIQECPHHAA